MKIAVPIGLLVDAIAEYKDVKLLSNQAVPTMDLICKVATPLGDFTPIKHIIKKENLQGFEIIVLFFKMLNVPWQSIYKVFLSFNIIVKDYYATFSGFINTFFQTFCSI